MSESAESLKPSKCISVEQARDLQNNWKATRAIYIEQSLGTEDAREFLFSVSELEHFLEYVKKASATEGISNPGVRIYFGTYDNDLTDKSTVFLAPTKGVQAGSDNNYLIEPLNKGISGHPPKNY